MKESAPYRTGGIYSGSAVEKAECWKEEARMDVTEGWRGLQGPGFSTQDRDDLAALG